MRGWQIQRWVWEVCRGDEWDSHKKKEKAKESKRDWDSHSVRVKMKNGGNHMLNQQNKKKKKKKNLIFRLNEREKRTS